MLLTAELSQSVPLRGRCSRKRYSTPKLHMARSRRKWRKSGNSSRSFPDARRKPLRRRAVRPRRAAHAWLDAARQAASNHLGGVFSRQGQAKKSVPQGVHLARRAPSVGESHHQYAEDEPPARPFRTAMRARIGSACLHTPVPLRRSDYHVSLTDCMVLESRATYGQIYQ